MNFEFIFNHAPEKAQLKFEGLRLLRERPDYHPEPNAEEHIKIVTSRCIASDNANLIMTAFFHDICKAETARLNPKNGFPTSPGHDTEAAKFIRENDDVKEMIRKFKADPEIVEWLVAQHMRIAQIGQMRTSKQESFRSHKWFSFLEAFHACDNMLVSDAEAITQMKQFLAMGA